MTWSRLSIQGSLVGVMGLSGDKDLMCSQPSSPEQGGVGQMFHCPLSHQLLRGWALCSHSSTWDARLKGATGKGYQRARMQEEIATPLHLDL